MESSSQAQYLLIGDVGGTNCRFELHELDGSDYKPGVMKNYKTQEVPTLESGMNAFLQESQVDASQVKAAVLAIAGPVEEGGTIPIMANIMHWGSLSEKTL